MRDVSVKWLSGVDLRGKCTGRHADGVLLAGNVITLGLYVPEVGGIRIEHDSLLTEQGYERLRNHTIALW